jgi:hypothetical protein
VEMVVRQVWVNRVDWAVGCNPRRSPSDWAAVWVNRLPRCKRPRLRSADHQAGSKAWVIAVTNASTSWASGWSGTTT